MANLYSDTVLQAARAFIKDENNKRFQLRPDYSNLTKMFLNDREYTIPALSSIRQAETQTATAMYLKKKDFTVASAVSCSPTGEQSGSGKVDLEWATKAVKIYTSFAQHAGNEVTMARAFANDLYNAEVSLFFGSSGLESALLTYLEANKSGVNNGESGTFDSTNDIMKITAANKARFYNYVAADMRMNNYTPMFMEAYNTFWTAEQQYYINQGSGNNTNYQFQFGDFEFYPSNKIDGTVNIGGSPMDSIHYVVPRGGVAILDWNKPQNRAAKSTANKSWGTFQSILFPEFTLDLFKVTDCADTSADGGSVQDYTEVWELSLNYALAKQPVPTTDETPIYKYGVRIFST